MKKGVNASQRLLRALPWRERHLEIVATQLCRPNKKHKLHFSLHFQLSSRQVSHNVVLQKS
jgi:hypothetical protein